MSSLPETTIRQIKEMRADGIPWSQIKEHFQISYHTARCAVDEEYRKYRSEENSNRKRKARAEEHCHHMKVSNVIPFDHIEARRSWMNRPDTRDLTGVLMGDPPAGRSAWDRRVS